MISLEGGKRQTVNPPIWNDGWEKVKAPLERGILELDRELLKNPHAGLDYFTDVDGTPHIRVHNQFSEIDSGLWETFSRQGEEFPLELLMNEPNDFKED